MMTTFRMVSYAAPVVLALCLTACHFQEVEAPPSVEFSRVPEVGPGGAVRMENIEGRAIGAEPGQRIVLYARSGTWWVQPFSDRRFATIQPDSMWKSQTHLGTDYAASLVGSGFVPRATNDELPATGGSVLAVATVQGGKSLATPVPKRLRFSGYEWDVHQLPSDSGGVLHANLASDAWTDASGRLHLRIAREAGAWTCAEISLLRSLGYGSYSFVVRGASNLEPGTVLGMFTWDDQEAGQNHREIDIELSRWGDPAIKNAQFVVQPYHVAANVFRFNTPAAALTHSFHSEPGRVSFKTVSAAPGSPAHSVAAHVFTSGVPSPGGEAVHINVWSSAGSGTKIELSIPGHVAFEGHRRHRLRWLGRRFQQKTDGTRGETPAGRH